MKPIRNQVKIQEELRAIEAETKQLSGYNDQDYGYAEEDYGFAAAGKTLPGAAGVPVLPTELVKAGTRLFDFKFRIENNEATAVDRIIALYAPEGYDEAKLAAVGHTVDGILKDGQMVPGAAATAEVFGTGLRTGRPIALLMAFAKQNNLRLIGITVTANDTDAFQTDLLVSRLNPFRKEGEETIDLANYFSPNNLTGKKIECDLINDGLDFSLDNQTVVKALILRNTVVTYTLRFGGIDNPAAKFDSRATFAADRLKERSMARGSGRR